MLSQGDPWMLLCVVAQHDLVVAAALQVRGGDIEFPRSFVEDPKAAHRA
ncbi:MAG: hypothetical protein AB1Z98_12925 [Nannocystaceae bacterium]